MDGPEEPLYFPSSESGSESDGLDDIKDVDQKPCLEEKTVSRSGISSDSDKEDGIRFVNLDATALQERNKKAETNRKRREREQRKRDETKAARLGKEAQASKPKRKSKSKSVTNDDNDSDDSNTAKATKKQKQDLIDHKVTVYIHVQSTAPPLRLAATSKNKGKPPPPAVSVKGPCFFRVQQSYDEFRAVLANELPCKLKHLPSDLVSWKYEKPANDAKKPLTTLSGYQALVMSLKEKRAGHVIIVSMPPPKVEDVTWDTGDGDYIAKPYDHYEETASIEPPDLSAKAQIADIINDSRGHLSQLQEKYPIGNSAFFPGIRTLTRVLGDKPHYWELTLLRLRIWSHSLSMGKAGVTLETPPNSIHFDMSNCITRKIPKPEDTAASEAPVAVENTAPGPNVQQQPQALAPQMQPAPPVYPYQYPPPPPWFFGHPQIPAGYMQPPALNYPGLLPYGQQGGPIPPLPQRDSPAGSPCTALQLRIPLADFCLRYEISKSDEDKLALLEYKPGNDVVLSLTDDDWKEVKFTKLGWRAFISAHKRFIRDVKGGLWTAG